MADSRYASTHLELPRRALYRERRDAAARSAGSETRALAGSAPGAPAGAIVLLDAAASHPSDTGFLTVAGNVTHYLRLGDNTIGRQPDNDVVIFDRKLHVSRRHCAISVHADGSAEIFDLASMNGTYLNGERVSTRSPLRTNDVVRLGDSLAFTIVLYG